MSVDAQKAQLRSVLRERRHALGIQEQERQAAQLARHVIASEPYRAAHTVMLYMAARGEIDLDAVMRDVLASGRRLALPRCELPGVMTAREARGSADLAPGSFGLMEPRACCPVVPPEEIGLVLVPGVAFDRRGGGYYDRFLPLTGAYRMGVCHSFALLDDALPCLAHDVRMDAVATADGVLPCSGRDQ